MLHLGILPLAAETPLSDAGDTQTAISVVGLVCVLVLNVVV